MLISELPQTYKELANKRKDNNCPDEDSVNCAFVWSRTPEGNYFWRNVHYARNEAELPSLPEPPLKQQIKEIIDGVPDVSDDFCCFESGERYRALMRIRKLVT